MSEERRKLYKGTGTVPKVKHRNNSNTVRLNQNDRYSNVLSNNLGREADQPDYIRGRNLHYSLLQMDPAVDQNSLRQNGLHTSNGTSTPNTSRTHSRRNSVGTVPKCDNVSKYPDKKQIEAKLSQIREYLRVTTSLVSNMKNTDEQSNEESMDREQLAAMIKDLVDSEAKLVQMLSTAANDDSVEEKSNNSEFSENSTEVGADASNCSSLSKNELEQKVDVSTREMEMLKEQENLLLHLQLNAESQLREARVAQEKLRKGHHIRNTNNLETDSLLNGFCDDGISNASSKHFNEHQTEMIRDLEDRIRNMNTDGSKNQQQLPEHYQNQIDSLQHKILQIRDGNDNRNQLVQMLDNRDAQLQVEHSALQDKLVELQNKKLQVDSLVRQLQNLNEESEDEEVGNQVKRIVNMKEQLAKLKDMLDIVQNTEAAIEAQNLNEPDVEEHVRRLCSKTDNLIQNDVRQNRVENNATARQENNSSIPRVKEKQINKKSMNANERERAKLQAELQAKKRELEELMCKHKAATSNLNHDVSSENKTDQATCSNFLLDGAANSWFPVPVYNLPHSSDRYSSDDCPEDDMNEYSEINSSGDMNTNPVPMPVLNYPTSNYTKRRDDEARIELPPDVFQHHAASRTPDRSVRSSTSIATPTFRRDRGRSNTNNEKPAKNQMQNQLELIRSVCNSMLDQSNPPTMQVRNNLTPSPIYSEPRQYASPNGHSMNALHVVNPTPAEGVAFPSVPQFVGDAGNYQNWLTTNTLQTQAFMLNTLNQCCQMLWFQQRELSSLRNTINVMQERYQNTPYEPNFINSNPPSCLFPAPIPNSATQSNNQYRPSNLHNHHQQQQQQQQQHQHQAPPPPPPKLNVPVAGATSMPNLNSHAHCSHTNMDACSGPCNVQTARILDSALNNNSVHNHVVEHANNSVLHSANQTLPSQIWNGQALNNQVAPGNRANNYWDNFRSYSRQNLLSTKSNEGLQNIATVIPERANNSAERPQPLQVSQVSQAAPKLNTENQEVNESVQQHQQQQAKVTRQRSNSSIAAVTVPPDVLNVNQKSNEFMLDLHSVENAFPFLNTFGESYNESQQQQETMYKESVNRRNRNEWHDDAQSENNSPKSKLFEELRENVYKEVASLISANQGRPHFLIQLFRDLQLISSDPLRRRTLQSIQSVITNSLSTPGSSTGATRQVSNSQPIESENVDIDNVLAIGDYFDMPPFLWPPKTTRNESEMLEQNSQEHLSEVLTFLNAHNEDIFSDSLVHALRDTLVESTFSAIFTTSNSKDGIIQKHFACLLTEALEQYRGKKVQDVRLSVLQTVEDLLRGEISLIRIMRENISENDLIDPATVPYDLQVPLVMEEPCAPQMPNGDLAEADQSRIEMDDEDEGAVGGVLNILLERSSSSNAGQVVADESDLPKLDLVLNAESDVEYVEQGLDQVPTRLTTRPSSRSNTPSKDKKNARIDGAEHF